MDVLHAKKIEEGVQQFLQWYLLIGINPDDVDQLLPDPGSSGVALYCPPSSTGRYPDVFINRIARNVVEIRILGGYIELDESSIG